MRYKRNFDYSPDEIIQVKYDTATAFGELLLELKSRYPSLKVVYAYYDTDPVAMHQYCLIIKQQKMDPLNNIPINVYFAFPVVNFGEHSLQVFELCKRDNKLDEFFSILMTEPISLPQKKFNHFINETCGLSTDKTSKKYWKQNDINIYRTLVKTFGEMGQINATILRAKK